MPYCRNCGAEFTEGTKFCYKCGAALAPATSPDYHITPGLGEITVSQFPRKDTGVTAIVAGFGGLILFGLGHFYVGKIGRGILFLLVGIIVKFALATMIIFMIPVAALAVIARNLGGFIGLMIFLVIANLGLWVSQIYDAYALAKKYNSEVQRTGRAPW
jgi:TM2 domain-containing membrane protein YozV